MENIPATDTGTVWRATMTARLISLDFLTVSTESMMISCGTRGDVSGKLFCKM